MAKTTDRRKAFLINGLIIGKTLVDERPKRFSMDEFKITYKET
ncbi:MAG: hypothetical protein ABFD18_20575 [Syntrophomonas sp.]